MKVAFFNSKTGITLIEVMIALMIIGIIIIGGGMFFFYGRVNIVQEAHRRAAVLVASQRLEALKAANWDEDDIAPDDPSFDPAIRYYLLGGASWTWVQPLPVLPSDPPDGAKETVTVENLSDGKMVTEAQWVDDDYLEVTVTVQWGDDTTNSVSSTTLIGP